MASALMNAHRGGERGQEQQKVAYRQTFLFVVNRTKWTSTVRHLHVTMASSHLSPSSTDIASD